ncbi:GNAT family N-acetyltransferase [Pseudomonas cavernae]|uniref:GNAT family N-acetyltransferase n=1 Tax=Pseudomonas cavernae TaxID=2320867 RepID=A0A385Z583_9PSED|nr:GNAT family N-acetyltransferase [Pseudomonas cavernae]AYC34306.1 GNAT family N-acetyltransferase [Pseudomonas cavernae]
MSIRPIEPDDHAALLALWRRTPGLRLRPEDEFVPFCAYLQRTPGLSLLCERQGRLLGCVLVGHDGRRGYLQHLVVDQPYRAQGVARALLRRALEQLAGLGVQKSHVFVLRDTPESLAFWSAQAAWEARGDIQVYSHSEESP